MEKQYLLSVGTSASQVLPAADANPPIDAEGAAVFYAYVLWTRGSELRPFYVGKGTGGRFRVHMRPHRLNRFDEKARFIIDAMKCGLDICVSFHAPSHDERNAVTEERRLIETLSPYGCLVNKSRGGEGANLAGRSKKTTKPVFVDGIEYPTVMLASAATGVSAGLIYARIRNGWPGYYRLGDQPRPCRKGRRRGSESPKSRAVIADGVQYATLTEAARALKVHPPAIFRRIADGWPGYHYANEGQRQRTRPTRGSAEHMRAARENCCSKRSKVIVDGIEYESMSAAARANLITYGTVRMRCARADWPNYKRLDGPTTETQY